MGRYTTGSAIIVMLIFVVNACASSPPAPNPTVGSRSAVWSVELPQEWGVLTGAEVEGDAVVVKTKDGVAVLRRRDGATRWWQAGTVGLGDQVYVTGDAVILVSERGSNPRLSVFDLETGKTRFFHELSGGDHRAVLTPVGPVVADCPPPGGSCTVARLDPRTGVATWHRDYRGDVRLGGIVQKMTGAATEDAAVPDYVQPLRVPDSTTVLVTDADGGRQQTTTVQARTGRVLASIANPPGTSVSRLVTSGRYLSWDPRSRDCALRITAGDAATGRQAWTASVGQWSPPGLGAGTGYRSVCDGGWTPVTIGDRLLAMTPDEHPELIDLDTGVVTWTGPAGAHLMGLAGNTAVVRADHDTGPLRGIDIATGRTRWTVGGVSGPLNRYGVSGDRLAYGSVRLNVTGELHIVDAATGAAWLATGNNWLLGMDPGWVVGASGGQGPLDDAARSRLSLFAS